MKHTTSYSIRLLTLVFIGSGFCDEIHTFDLNSHHICPLRHWRYQKGDRPEWAGIDFDDSTWRVIHELGIEPEQTGIHWFRFRINLKGNQDDYDVLALRMTELASAFEVFWDGKLIARNGQVSETEEIPGFINRSIKFKPEWTRPGLHVLAIRFSNYHRKSFLKLFRSTFGYFQDHQYRRTRYQYACLVLAVFYMAVASLCAVLFWSGGRHRSFLYFAIPCLLIAIYSAIIFITTHWDVNILFSNYTQYLKFADWIFEGILINVFILFNFEIPRKRFHICILGLIPIFIIALGIDYQTVAFMNDPLMKIYGLGLLIYSVIKRKRGGVPALIGMLLFSLLVINSLYRLVHPVIFNMFAYIQFPFFIIFALGSQIKEQNRIRETEKLRSHRLETELLKKSIQPHFLMNTLLSIISCIRENPKQAIKLIMTLADEFRLINRVSSEMTIPLKEEIQLCEYHLQLMSLRNEVQYRLVQENVDKDDAVPPMIFHTLIENGLSHAYQPKEAGTFRLCVEKNHRSVRYRLSNDGSLLKLFSQKPRIQIEEGLGMKYIKARLEERYPARWRVEYGLKNGKWEVEIHIMK